MERSCEFLFWAYNVVWIALAAYVAFLALGLRKVGRRLEGLERRAEMRPDGAGTP